MPLPQTTATDIHQQLKRIQARGHFIDPLSIEYSSLEREIRKLIQSDAKDGYGILGALCGMTGDIEGLRSNFDKAFRLSADPILHHNYAVALINAGFFSEARQSISVLERPENGRLAGAIVLNTECARFQRVVALIKKWNDIHREEPRRLENLPEIARVIENAGIGEDDFLPCLDIVGDTLRRHRLIFLGEPVIRVIDDEGQESISFRFLVRVSAKTAAELDSELVDRLFDSDIRLYESTIRFGYLAAEELAKQAA